MKNESKSINETNVGKIYEGNKIKEKFLFEKFSDLIFLCKRCRSRRLELFVRCIYILCTGLYAITVLDVDFERL